MAVAISSAQGLLSLLREDNLPLKHYALKSLISVSDFFWHELADPLSFIVGLAAQEEFPHRELAALLGAQVYYHLEQYDKALELALKAGTEFDIARKTPFTQKLVSVGLDQYIAQQWENYGKSEEEQKTIDPRLGNIVELMFEGCFRRGEFTQAIGMILEARRLDKLAEAVKRSGRSLEMLKYAYRIVAEVTLPRDFRREVIVELVKLHALEQDQDYASVTECRFFLNEPVAVGELLSQLSQTDFPLALQLALDLVENQNQQFLTEVAANIPEEPQAAKLKDVLSGKVTTSVHFDFYSNSSSGDKMLLANIKNATEAKNSVTHGAVVFANALMFAGTGNDTFLRDNLDWVSKATNWSKFSAAASLGVIHKGNIAKAMDILNPYLPGPPSPNSSPYSEGGALYALGLIHADRMDSATVSYLVAALQNTQNETVQHGVCLGLGMIAMASGDSAVVDSLKQVLFTDSAVAGEAAAYGIGLVLLGNAHADYIEELLKYAHETQHEKIIRAIALTLALMMYGREEEADPLITQLSTDKDPLLRYGGAYMLATAYCGTSNQKVVRKLLHVAVSDVDYDVRRAAVTGLGFVLLNEPDQLPKTISLLCESYNPFVRQGAALALAVAFAGNPAPEALSLLDTLLGDNVNYVRQAALIGTAMVLMQCNKQMNPKIEKFTERLDKCINDKHAETLTKMGSIVAYGILNAAGKNANITLRTKSGNLKGAAVVGLVLGLQFWYWFPLLHIFSLAFSPTCLIGLTDNLRIPKSFKFTSKARPSLFAYTPQLENAPTEKVISTQKTTLSTTARAKARAQAKKPEPEKAPAAAMEVDKPDPAKDAPKEEEKKPETNEQVLSNPSRVLPLQEGFIQYHGEERYKPVLAARKAGIVVLRDLRPEEAETYLGQAIRSEAAGEAPAEAETEMPEEFDFDADVQKRAFT